MRRPEKLRQFVSARSQFYLSCGVQTVFLPNTQSILNMNNCNFCKPRLAACFRNSVTVHVSEFQNSQVSNSFSIPCTLQNSEICMCWWALLVCVLCLSEHDYNLKRLTL